VGPAGLSRHYAMPAAAWCSASTSTQNLATSLAASTLFPSTMALFSSDHSLAIPADTIIPSTPGQNNLENGVISMRDNSPAAWRKPLEQSRKWLAAGRLTADQCRQVFFDCALW